METAFVLSSLDFHSRQLSKLSPDVSLEYYVRKEDPMSKIFGKP